MASTPSRSSITINKRLSREHQVKKRAPRRRRTRNEPLQLQFLTANDPAHFKNDDTRRSVRSHAMTYHRNRPRREVQLPQRWSGTPATRKGPIVSVLVVEQVPCGRHSHTNAPDKSGEHLDEQQRNGNETALRTDGVVNKSATLERTCRTHRRLPATCTPPTRLTKHKADSAGHGCTQSQEERVLRCFMARVATIFHIGDGVDPFQVLPNFKNPEIDSLSLKRYCIRIFASDSFFVKWLPALLSHPHVLLSTLILASVWLDTLSDKLAESEQTFLLKGEIISMINERLQHPTTRSSDTTIMVVLHLLAGDTLACNEIDIRVHERGVAKLLLHRGGIHGLGNEALGETAAVCCYHGNLINETEPLPALAAYTLTEDQITNHYDSALESPLFCPGADFVTISADSYCSTATCGLLRDMRDLTDLFISHHAAFEIVCDTHETDAGYVYQRDVEYNSQIGAIRKRLTKLPAARIPGLPTSNDWIYEACRITALIYAASMILRVPFSVTANPRRNPLVTESEASSCLGSDASLLQTHLSEALFKALQRTDIADLWKKMSGVFYWVSTVGAAAARSLAAAPELLQQQSRDVVYAKWLQRRLAVYSSRAMIKLGFDHARPILVAQKKLLRIQELISRGDGVDAAVGILLQQKKERRHRLAP